MAEGYVRQSVFIDGDVILADHGNLEFDKLVAAFNADTGHDHDGTAAGGAAVPLLKDPSNTHDFTLVADGVQGSVVLDEDGLTSDSDKHLATQQSIKAYADGLKALSDSTDANLQLQIDTFANSNHGHLNLDVIDDLWTMSINTSTFNLEYGRPALITASTAVNVTPIDLIAGRVYSVANSRTSTATVEFLNPGITITGDVVVAPGTNITLEPGDLITVLATSTSAMEVV